MAAVLDTSIVVIPVVLVWLGTGRLDVAHGKATFSPGWAGIIFLWLVAIAYWTVFEALSGATPGKRVMRIHVVSTRGEAVGWWRSAVRNVLRVVDQFMCVIVGPMFMAVTPRRQRVGDLAAGTEVRRKAKEVPQSSSL